MNQTPSTVPYSLPLPPAVESSPPCSTLVPSSPSGWFTAGIARPRLKRAHSSSASPGPPHNSPSEPLSPALQASPLAPAPDSHPHPHPHLHPLEIIQEVPQAESLATSPAPAPSRIPARPLARPELDHRQADDDGPTKSKRRRLAPDHDAFSRLSLNYSPIPSNSTSTLFVPPALAATRPTTTTATPPLTSPTYPAFPFPAVPPTSPDFLPAHPYPAFAPSSPPHFAPLPKAAQSLDATLVPPPTRAQTFATPPPPPPPPRSASPVTHSRGGVSADDDQLGQEVEMTTRPVESTWDLDRHRIYVASLSDDDDDGDDGGVDGGRGQTESERDELERFKLNSLISSGLPRALVLAHGGASTTTARGRRGQEGGALILYQPPPSLGQLVPSSHEVEREDESKRTATAGAMEASLFDDATREQRERKREEEFREFRRESERIEADDLVDERQDDMDMELEL